MVALDRLVDVLGSLGTHLSCAPRGRDVDLRGVAWTGSRFDAVDAQFPHGGGQGGAALQAGHRLQEAHDLVGAEYDR